MGKTAGNLRRFPESGLPLIVIGVRVKFVGPKKERTVLVEQFFKGHEETIID